MQHPFVAYVGVGFVLLGFVCGIVAILTMRPSGVFYNLAARPLGERLMLPAGERERLHDQFVREMFLGVKNAWRRRLLALGACLAAGGLALLTLGSAKW